MFINLAGLSGGDIMETSLSSLKSKDREVVLFFLNTGCAARRNPSAVPAGKPGNRPFVPRVEGLEDRALPSVSPLPHLTAPPATHFKVVVPAHTQAGRPAVGEVIALTASNHRAFGYTGTVQLSDTDTAAHLPATLRFSRFAHGARFFVFTPETGGSDTITATDTGTASIT